MPQLFQLIPCSDKRLIPPQQFQALNSLATIMIPLSHLTPPNLNPPPI